MEETGGTAQYIRRTGEGIPVLLIHGILCDHHFYDRLAEELQDTFRVIVYDRRGYGESEAADGDYSLKAQAEDAALALEGETPAFVVGHSAGGIVAAELAVRYPEKVRGLLLIEPAFAFGETEAEAMRGWNEELTGYIRNKRLGLVMRAFTAHAGAAGKASSGGKIPDRDALVRAKKNLENFVYGEIGDIQCCRPAEEDLRDLGCPVTVGVTEQGRDGFFGKICRADALRMGWPTKDFPGFHTSATEFPEAYAKIIKEIITGGEQ